jgi:hypothetical protein
VTTKQEPIRRDLLTDAVRRSWAGGAKPPARQAESKPKAAPVSVDEMTYRMSIGFWLLVNVLISAVLYVLVDTNGTHWTVAPGVVCNLFSYLVLVGALRHPGRNYRH